MLAIVILTSRITVAACVGLMHGVVAVIRMALSTALGHSTRFLVVGWAGRVSLSYTAIRFFSRSIPRFRISIYLPVAPSRFQNDDSSARLYLSCEAAHFCCSRCMASGDIGATIMAL